MPYIVIIIIFLNKCISDFIPFSPNLVANHTPVSSITPPCYFSSTACTSSMAAQAKSQDPVEWHAFSKPHPPPDCHNSRSPRRSELLSPPPSLGVTGQLCYSNTSQPNSAPGRGGIRNPVPRCLTLANQRLRPPRLYILWLLFPLGYLSTACCRVFFISVCPHFCMPFPCFSHLSSH